jgi:hypothetical protein
MRRSWRLLRGSRNRLIDGSVRRLLIHGSSRRRLRRRDMGLLNNLLRIRIWLSSRCWIRGLIPRRYRGLKWRNLSGWISG